MPPCILGASTTTYHRVGMDTVRESIFDPSKNLSVCQSLPICGDIESVDVGRICQVVLVWEGV